MINAQIIDNYPYCPKCETFDFEIIGVAGMAIIENEKYIELNARCNRCGKEIYYFLDTKLEKRISVSKESTAYSKYAEKGEEI